MTVSRALTVALVLCVSAQAGGCSTVYSTHPVGETVLDIEAQKEDWAGTWAGTDSSFVVATIVDGKNGILRIGWIEKKGDQPVLVTAQVFLRQSGGWTFASMQEPGKPDDAPYLWARLKRTGRTLMFWTSDAREFRELIRAGKLPGTAGPATPTTTEPDPVLSRLDAERLNEIVSEKHGVLFEWDSPTVLIRQ